MTSRVRLPILRIANSASPSRLFTNSQFSQGKQEASKTPQKPISENREFCATPSPHHKFSILTKRAKSIQNARMAVSENRKFKAAPSSLITNSQFSQVEEREARSVQDAPKGSLWESKILSHTIISSQIPDSREERKEKSEASKMPQKAIFENRKL